MPQTATRNEDGQPVFVLEDGSYTKEFPEERIIKKTDASEGTVFIVYSFVGNDEDFEGQRWLFETKPAAISKATYVYGRDDIEGFSRDGEVYRVEIEERGPDYV